MFVPVAAEADEGGTGAFQFWPPAIVPPRHPFVIERVHVIARRCALGIVEAFRVDKRSHRFRLDCLGRFQRLAIAEGDRIAVHLHGIVGQMIVGDEIAQHRTKHAQMAARAGFLLKGLDGNRPFFLGTAMLAGQLVNPAFERFPKAEIIAVQRQNAAPFDHLEQPFGQRDLDLGHLARAGFPHYPPFVDEAEAFRDFLSICLDVGRDARS